MLFSDLPLSICELCAPLCALSLSVTALTGLSLLLSLPLRVPLLTGAAPVIHSCAAEDLELDLERELEEPPEPAPPADDSSRTEISPGQVGRGWDRWDLAGGCVRLPSSVRGVMSFLVDVLLAIGH